MENLKIDKTKSTLAVNFNSKSGVCKLAGSSYPENSIIFFKPLIKWISAYIDANKNPVSLELRLNYINTSSTKCLLDIFEILERHRQLGGKVKIYWYYRKDEEDMKETGEELIEDIDLPVDFIAY